MIIGLEWNQADDITQWLETISHKIFHLVESNNKVYGINEQGLWIEIEALTLASLDFEVDGIESITVITEEQWLQLQKPIKILTWTDNTEATSTAIGYEQKEFVNPKLELTVPDYKPIELFDEPEIVTLVEDDEAPQLRIEGFRDLRPYMESDNPKLLINTDAEEPPVARTNSVPHRQLVLAKNSIKLNMLKEIQTFTIASAEDLGGIMRVVFSVDGGATWKTYNNSNSEFEAIDIANLDNIKNSGMTAGTFNSIGTRWNEVVTESQIMFGYYLEMEDENSLSNVDKLEVVMDVLGSWEGVLHEVDYNYEYDNEKIYIELYKDGSYKINYM